MIKKIYHKLCFIIKEAKWGHKGKNSKVIRPMRIIGKRNIFIGDNVLILNNARMETVATKNSGQVAGSLKIGDGTSIEQNCHIIAANTLEIGRDCVMSANVYISDCNHGYSPKCRIMDQPLEIKKTTIGDGVFIGIGAKIMPGVTLGDYCVVGANAVVTHDVPKQAIVAGVPAKIIGQNK